ncbi:hypothetical protein OH77DRAFT_1426915 [Trametes cingulata]|nr:hypothetical protein OH77DRAFT_1426915 [Trametes cingulata]
MRSQHPAALAATPSASSSPARHARSTPASSSPPAPCHPLPDLPHRPKRHRLHGHSTIAAAPHPLTIILHRPELRGHGASGLCAPPLEASHGTPAASSTRKNFAGARDGGGEAERVHGRGHGHERRAVEAHPLFKRVQRGAVDEDEPVEQARGRVLVRAQPGFEQVVVLARAFVVLSVGFLALSRAVCHCPAS